MLSRITNQLSHILLTEDMNNSVDYLTKELKKYNRIFISGAGRSGFVSKFFAMRLMHLGIKVYVVGETTTPAIGMGDALIIISGSGETHSMINLGKKAKVNGASIILITSNPIGKLVDLTLNVVLIDTSSPIHSDINVMPLGTRFELSTLLFLEAVVATFMFNYSINEDHMKELHTNLE